MIYIATALTCVNLFEIPRYIHVCIIISTSPRYYYMLKHEIRSPTPPPFDLSFCNAVIMPKCSEGNGSPCPF